MSETQHAGPFEPHAIAYFKSELGTALRSERHGWANAIIRELHDLQRDPGRSASETLASFLSDAGLLGISELNFVYNSVGHDGFSGARLRKRLKIHHRVLLHAVLSGFLTASENVPLFQRTALRTPWGAELN